MSRLHAYTLGDVLRENARSYPNQVALGCADVRLTYPEFDDRVNRLAGSLAREGVGTGDRILWLGQNCHRVLELLLAAAKLGAIFCPANWRQSAPELSFVIVDTDPRVVVWQDEEIGATVKEARGDSKALWIQHDDGEYEQLVKSGSPNDSELGVDPTSPVLMMYTAAFGGRPNGALLTHEGIVAQNLVMAMVQGVDRNYVYLNSGPLFHIATFMTTLATFHYGGTNIFLRRFDPDEFCQVVERERVTGAFVVGAMMQQVIEANKDRRYDLKSLRAFPGPSEWMDMTSPDTARWGQRPGGYGQTEVMGMATLSAFGEGGTGSHGRSSPIVQIRIVDENDVEVGLGETGEIVVRGPSVMAGYHNRPELNAERQRNGWHHTTDLGRRETDGSITFIGPKTTLIKSAAENVYPAEVEACIQRHPAVQEACVIGVPDPTWTQNVKAVVVLRAGAEATAEDIIEHCRKNIASYKKPKTVEFTDALPRAATGMVDRDAVDAAFGGGGYPGRR